MKIDELKRFFKDDKYIELSGIEILSADDEKAVVGAKILPHHLNANGVVQGGMLYTLADAAFAVLSNNLHPVTVSQAGNIAYIAPADTDYVTAEAVELVRSKRNNVVQVTIKDSTGKIVSTATINGFISAETTDKITTRAAKEE